MSENERGSDSGKHSLRNFIIVLTALSLFLIFLGWILYDNFRGKLISEIQNELISVANMKNREICHWREERIRNLAILQNEVFGLRIKQVTENPENTEARNRMLDWMRQFEKNYGYSRVCIHDLNGVEVLTTKQGESHMPNEIGSYYDRIFGKSEIVIENFYFDRLQKKNYLPVVAGMFDFTEGEKKPVGIFIAKIEPSPYLLPLLEEWPGERKTTDSFLFRMNNGQAVLMDFGTGKTGNISLTEESISDNEFKISADKMNVKYFTYTSKVHNTPWYILVQISKEEALEPLNSLLAGIAFGLLLIIILFSFGTLYYYKKQEYDHMSELTRKSFELEQSNARYKSMFENTHAVMFIVDPENGNIIDANPAAVEKYGWTIDELKKMKVSDINVLTYEKSMENVRKVAEGVKNHFIFQHRKKNGEIADVEIFAGPIQYGSKKALFSIVHDITEKQKEIESGREKLIGLIDALKKLTGAKSEKDIENILTESALRLVKAKDSGDFFKNRLKFDPADKMMISKIWGEYLPDKTDIDVFKTLSDTSLIAYENVRLYEEMDDKVKIRTQELTEKTSELEQRSVELVEQNEKLVHFRKLFTEREFRIKELRDKVKELESRIR